MKKNFSLFLFIFAFIQLNAQVEIVKETFGSGGTFNNLAQNYTNYSSSAVFSSNKAVFIRSSGSGGTYVNASGGNGVELSEWGVADKVGTALTISGINTEGYENVFLGFGMIWNSGGWGGEPCNLTNNYIGIEYSTDGSAWTSLNVGILRDGSQWPCSNSAWQFVKLGENLPVTSNLWIRITHTATSAVHPIKIDDITIFGFSPDETPPTDPSNLQSSDLTAGSVKLTWNASTDDFLSGYYIKNNGSVLAVSTDTTTILEYLIAGQTYDFNVVAFDEAGNMSGASNTISVTIPDLPVDYKYSWEDNQADMLSNGDIIWSPKEFELVTGSSVRYIDYENGDDANDGLSTSTAWKHHPWDNNATGVADATSGTHTYIFKRGVVYRGTLIAQESGAAGDPIRLTSDPAWGTGEAGIFGSRVITGGWTQADATSAPNVPDPTLVWYQDIAGLGDTKTICEFTGDTIKRVRVARSPNYQEMPEEPMKYWWEFKTKDKMPNGTLQLGDPVNLTAENAAHYQGGDVWATEDVVVMCTLWKQKIDNFDASTDKITVASQDFGGVDCKYYVENTPYLLDTTGEFYYDKSIGRLFIRLDKDADPNSTTIEIATKSNLIDINGKSNIEISGLMFAMTTTNNVRYNYSDGRPAIKINGSCSNIVVKNCMFQNLNAGILAVNSNNPQQPMQNLIISDNEMNFMDDFSIIVHESGGYYVNDVYILRNKIYENGTRHMGRWYGSIPAVLGHLVTAEIAGNVIENTWGNGLNFFWGRDYNKNSLTVPLVRGLVHSNKVYRSMLGVNDYGGIESWQGGPAFYYNNISYDAQGYKYNWNSSLGYAYYFDGAFKNYCFNNIATGRGPSLNSGAYQQVLGFYNMYVHNLAYNLKSITTGGNGNLSPDGQNCYLSNIGEEVDYQFNHSTRESGAPFESFGYNVFSGERFLGKFLYGTNPMLFDDFKALLEQYDADLTQVGYETSYNVLSDPANGDFRPAPAGEAIDRGVKFFAPYPLSRVVGEWHFYKHKPDSTLVKADNFYYTTEYNGRENFKNVPKNHLKAYGLSDTSYVFGDLEDWTEGAMLFKGITYCEAKNNDIKSTICNNLDMTNNDFIIELYLKLLPDVSDHGVIISKYSGSGYGYMVDLDESGYPRFSITNNGSAEYSVAGSTTLSDNNWHHLLVEVNRVGSTNIFIDGELATGSVSGSMPGVNTSLSNTADFYIGKDMNNRGFYGYIDFVRVSKGLLLDAKTTINELYKWEFDGPFLYDFAGNAPIGKRDAGPLEKGTKICDMSVNPKSIEFSAEGDQQIMMVNASEGYEISKTDGDFFSYNILNQDVTLIAEENLNFEKSEGEIWIFGCNETVQVPVSQLGADCVFDHNIPDTVFFSPSGETKGFRLTANSDVVIKKDGNFYVNVSHRINEDSITIKMTSTKELHYSDITLEGCAEPYTFVAYQPVPTFIAENGDQFLKIYPNPLKGNKIYIEASSTYHNALLTIQDLSGKVIFSFTIDQNINYFEPDLKAGAYVMNIKADDEVHSEVLIVE